MKLKLFKLIAIALLVCLFPLNTFADAPLRSIIIFGNTKTERKTILSIINVEPRSYVDKRLLADVETRMSNSGLFKSVRIVTRANPDGTEDLRINVVEKQLWFVVPIVSVGSGRYAFGAAFGESNLLMPNTGTLITAQGGNRMNRFFYALDSKNIFDSDMSLRFWTLVRKDFVPLYTDRVLSSEIVVKDVAANIAPGFQWTNEIRTSYGITYRYIDFGASAVVAEAGTKAHDVSMGFEFLYDSLKRKDGFIQGNLIKAGFEFSGPRFGSDYTYNMESVEWTHGMDLFKYLNHVLLFKGMIGDNLPFHRHITMGNNNFRGFKERQFRGDTQLFLRNDFLFPIFRQRLFTIFGLGFHDMALLYFDKDGIDQDSFNNGVGGGLRVSLSSILAPVFGLDFGYGIENKSYELILALGLVSF